MARGVEAERLSRDRLQKRAKVHLRSRNDQDFNGRYTEVVKALAGMPDETVIDGEIVALDADGRPSFNTLQNCGSAKAPVFYYVFDLLCLRANRSWARRSTRAGNCSK